MTSFRMFEIILYSMVSLLPYLGLALYPFEDKFRMSKIKLSGCIRSEEHTSELQSR